MKKQLFILVIAGLLSGVRPAHAYIGMGFDRLGGLVGTASHANSEQYGNGFAVNANVVFVIFNGGFEHISFNQKSINNVYLGLGWGGALQLQLGTGNAGSSIKLRSDLSFKQLMTGGYDKQFEFPGNDERKTLADRWILSFGFERYFDENRSTNFQIGLGLLF